MTDWKLAAVVGVVALGGVAVGATCFGAPPASAQSRAFTRCFIAYQQAVDVDGSSAVGAPDPAHLIDVPSNWVVVGGGGVWQHIGGVLLCSTD